MLARASSQKLYQVRCLSMHACFAGVNISHKEMSDNTAQQLFKEWLIALSPVAIPMQGSGLIQ
eukprot:4273262-Lingulodinium_polyedra.AAC.1